MRRFSLARLRLWWERAFWVIPLLGVIVGAGFQSMVSEIDDLARWDSQALPSMIAASSASQLLSAIGSGMITFTGFVFSFVVLILQFGSSQYSPRTVSYFLRARSTQCILGIFLATISFTFLSLLDVGSSGDAAFTPVLTVLAAIGLLFISLIAFIMLLHLVGSRVRVDAVLSAMGRQARRQLPPRLVPPRGAVLSDVEQIDDGEGLVVRSREAGQTVAIDARHVLRIAQRHRMRVVVLVQIGDAATIGSPLMRVYRGTDAALSGRVLRSLASAVVIDQERSLRHDPFYSLRLLADIAIRALSPAVNDPTTAVRALDEIEGVLRVAAVQPLGVRTLRAGSAEVVLRAPSWGDVVALGLLEIAICGSGQPQVTRRLMALIDDVLADLPPQRHPALEQFREELLARLQAADLSPRLAGIAAQGDRQGLGGTVV